MLDGLRKANDHIIHGRQRKVLDAGLINKHNPVNSVVNLNFLPKSIILMIPALVIRML